MIEINEKKVERINESNFDKIKYIYNLNDENFISFCKNFSLKEMINKSLNQLKEMKNGVCILVNTNKNIMISDCKWNIEKLKIFTNLNNHLTANYISQFINSFSNKIKERAYVHLFKFNTGSDIEEIDLSQNMDLDKKLIQLSMGPDNNKCEVEKSLSKLYNIEESILKNNNSSNYFLRVILLMSSPSSPIETDLLKSIFSSFNSQNLFNSIVLNFLLFESDYYFNTYTKNSNEIKSYTDFKQDDDCLNKSTEKLNFLLNIYDNEESNFLILNDKIIKFGNNFSYDNNNSGKDKLKSLLTELIDKIENQTKFFFDLLDSIDYNIFTYNKPETRKAKKNEIKIECLQFEEKNLIDKAYEDIKIFLDDYFVNQNLINLIDTEVIKILNYYRIEISNLENKIINKGKIF